MIETQQSLQTLIEEIKHIEDERAIAWSIHQAWLASPEFKIASVDKVTYQHELSPRINVLIETRRKQVTQLQQLYAKKARILAEMAKEEEKAA